MSAVAGFIVLWGIFNWGAKSGIERSNPAKVSQASSIEQAGRACESGNMLMYQKGSLKFKCMIYSTEEK